MKIPYKFTKLLFMGAAMLFLDQNRNALCTGALTFVLSVVSCHLCYLCLVNEIKSETKK